MATIYDLKPRFQNILRPLSAKLVVLGIKPNAITWLALVGSLAVGGAVFISNNHPVSLLLLAVWLLIRMSLNALDGMLAREFRMATSRGAVLNELGDVLSDLALYLPLARSSSTAVWPVIAFAIGAMLTELCGVLGQALGGRRRYEGPMGKSDRAVMVGALALLTALLPATAGFWTWVFTIASLLTITTCCNRISHALRDTELNEIDRR